MQDGGNIEFGTEKVPPIILDGRNATGIHVTRQQERHGNGRGTAPNNAWTPIFRDGRTFADRSGQHRNRLRVARFPRQQVGLGHEAAQLPEGPTTGRVEIEPGWPDSGTHSQAGWTR